jgi:hypothetical protein
MRPHAPRSVRASVAVGGGTPQTSTLVEDAVSSVADAFCRGRGEAPLQLGTAFSPQVRVLSTIWPSSSRAEWEQQIFQFGQFLTDPMYEVLSVESNERSATVDWMISGTWPLPWRPRALALGKSTLELAAAGSGGTQVVSVTEKLTTSPLEVLGMQLLPNWEDVYNMYNTPPAETRPYRVLRRARSYELRWVPPALAIQADVFTGEYPCARSRRLSNPALPDFVFTGKPLRSKNPEFSAIRPISVTCDASGKEAGKPCRYRYYMPVPSRLGADPARLPSLTSTPLESGAEAMEYSLRPGRYVAVRRMAGSFDVDSALLEELDKLVAELRADGVAIDGGDAGARPPFELSRYNTKIGFNFEGEIAIAQYQGTIGPLRRNEIAVEVRGVE